jgi:rubrerythrin
MNLDGAFGALRGSSETPEGLKCAIGSESYEHTEMYPAMAKIAREEGFVEIAAWFETLAKAERAHAQRFQRALDEIDGAG